MKRVLKYELRQDTIQVPSGKVILVAQQYSQFPTVWIEIEDNPPPPISARDNVRAISTIPGAMTLFIRGTGHAIEDNEEHVGSCLCGDFVWHVYKRN